MQITGKDIEKQCKRIHLIRGKALYASKAVQNLCVVKDYPEVVAWMKKQEQDVFTKYIEESNRITHDETQENHLFVAMAKVVGSTGNEYHVELFIDDESTEKFPYAHCDCDGFSPGEGFCKHCVAVGHNLVMQQLEEKLSDRLISGRELEQRSHETAALRTSANAATTPITRTVQGGYSSSAVRQLIKVYSGEDQALYWNSGNEATTSQTPTELVELQPNLLIGAFHSPVMEFRIGTSKKKYVVKDIKDFYSLVENQEFFSYGKQLGFVHDKQNFTEDSLYYIDMIQDMDSLMKGVNNYDVSNSYRYMPMSESYIEQLILRSVQSGLFVNGVQCSVMDHNPKISLTIEKEESGASVSIPNLTVIKGLSKTFVFDETKQSIYITSDGFRKKAVPLIETMQEFKDWNYYSIRNKNTDCRCFLAHQDYISFCGHVLRKVEHYFDIVEKDVELASFMPQECQIKIYLDTTENDEITCNLKACYGEESYNLSDRFALNEGDFRDWEREQSVLRVAKLYFPNEQRVGQEYLLTSHSEDNLYRLMESGLKELREFGELYVSESLKAIKVTAPPMVSAGINVRGNLLELSVDIPEMSDAEIGEILSAYRMKKKYYRLKNGDFMRLEESGFGNLVEMSEGLGLKEDSFQDGKIEMPLYRASFVDAVMREQGKHLTLVRSSAFRSIIRDMKEVADSDYEVPSQITAHLRGYQKTGYRWLRTLAHYGFGGILADDMGLGKTLQVITLLQSVMLEEDYDQKESTALIVCPASLIYNWESEFEKFAPEIRTRVVVGTAAERKKKLGSFKHVDVVITSYDLLKRDLELYDEKAFSYMIIDEAQYIKNATTQVARAVKKIDARVRFALTGTPLENRLSDLWSIFDFVMAGYLYSYDRFRQMYEHPIVNEKDEDTLARLQKLVTPFILRRRKKEVLKDLPDKIENVMYMSMTEEQKKYYRARFVKLKKDLANKTDAEFKAEKMQVLAELTRLRQLCCDPGLFIEDYAGGSGKVDAFLSMVEELTAGGSNILVFSQFSTMLHSLKEKLDAMGIHTMILTGQDSKEQRRSMVETFQAGTSTVFLISLKAGGTGLNLTAADTVIHFDPWWNVAAQNQATDRAHRIGQEKVVNVIQLVTKHSIEERIIDLQNKKKELVDQVIEGEAVASATLTKEEIMGLLEESV